jgi:hypothetical protein
MYTMSSWFDRAWLALRHWTRRHSVPMLRVSLGVIFCWFGGLKFFAGACSAEGLAARTIEVLTFGLM